MTDAILAAEQLLTQLELDIQLAQDRGQHIRAVQRRDSLKQLVKLLVDSNINPPITDVS